MPSSPFQIFKLHPVTFLYIFRLSQSTASKLIPTNYMADFQTRDVLNVLNKVLLALITCVFAFGGAVVGSITGAIKGQTTETGFLRGAGVGAVTGAIIVVQLMDMMANSEPFSKIALLHSLRNGKVFDEWINPAVIKAYQWQTSAIEITFADSFDEENNGIRGLSEHCINSLPKFVFKNSSKEDVCNEIKCVICLQEFKNKEEGRELPTCRHVFHLKCIDEWLIRQGSRPICRRDVTRFSERKM